MKTIVLTNQKGGVGKTTTALALGMGLHNEGKRVLFVDADPQGNLSFSLGLDVLDMEATLFDVFKNGQNVSGAIHAAQSGVSCLTIGLSGAAADMQFTQLGREQMLKQSLAEVKANYDYCVIDTQPNLGILAMNALTAADVCVIPLSADAYSMQGIYQLSGFIENIRQYTNTNLRVGGLLLTQYNERLNISQALTEQIEAAAAKLNASVYKTRIRQSVAIRESQLLQADFYAEAPKAAATIDYKAFVDEFLRTESEVQDNGK